MCQCQIISVSEIDHLSQSFAIVKMIDVVSIHVSCYT